MRRLRYRSVALVGIALLPAMVIQAANEWSNRRALADELRHAARREAEAAAADVGQLFETVRQLLATLSYVPSVRNADLAACDELFRTVVREDPAYLNIATADRDGRILCSAVPPAPGISAKGRPYFRALETGSFTVGEYTKGQTIPIPLIQLSLPIRGNGGAPIGVIWAALRLDRLQAHLERRVLPAHTTLTVVDRNGTVLARVPDAGLRGRQLGPGFRPYLDATAPGTVVATGLDGVERVFGYTPLAARGVSVGAGIDRRAAFAEIDASTRRAVALILAGMVLAMLAAVLGSRRFIEAPVAQLAAAARRWRRGDLTARAALPRDGSELARLGAVFDDMAGMLAAREAALRESEERLDLAVRAAGIGVFDWHIPSGRVVWSEQEERLFGLEPGTFEGAIAGWSSRVLPDDLAAMQALIGDAMARQEPGLDFVFRIRRADGEIRHLEGSARFLYAADGKPLRMVGVNIDVTERRRAEAALREAEAGRRAADERERRRLKAVVEGITEAVVAVFPKEGLWLRNPAWLPLHGFASFDELPGPEVSSFGHLFEIVSPTGERLSPDQYPITRVLRGEQFSDLEVRLRRTDKPHECWVSYNGTSVLDPDGAVALAILTMRDVSGRKAAEERQRLLLSELSHRVKNILAVVQAIAARSLSGRRSLPEARESFTRRVQALATAHTLLTASGWRGASLKALVEAELEPYGRQTTIRGEDVSLGPKAAQTVSLVLHELATNAVKHGSLSASGGRVEVGWHTFEDGAGPMLAFHWRERGGPPVTAPDRQGFGRLLLERAASHDLDGEATLAFRPEGLAYELKAPLERMLAAE